MQSRALEILVGFFVVLGVAAVMLLTLKVASLQDVGGKDGVYHLKVHFENVGKLSVGGAARIAGVKVGRVAKISVDPTNFEALVELEIARGYSSLPIDTSASILTAGLLGEQYIGLEPGGDEKFLKEGDEIRLTQSALVIENLIGQLVTSMTEKKEDSKLAEALGRIADALPAARKPAAAE